MFQKVTTPPRELLIPSHARLVSMQMKKVWQLAWNVLPVTTARKVRRTQSFALKERIILLLEPQNSTTVYGVQQATLAKTEFNDQKSANQERSTSSKKVNAKAVGADSIAQMKALSNL
jgi:hypothetical protein